MNPSHNKALTLTAMSLGFVVVQLDVTVVNVAVKSIGAALGGGSWTVLRNFSPSSNLPQFFAVSEGVGSRPQGGERLLSGAPPEISRLAVDPFGCSPSPQAS